MRTNDFPETKPLIIPFDPAFDLRYDPRSFMITNENLSTAIAGICCTSNSHVYGRLFARSPALYTACRRSRTALWTIMSIMDRKMPDWRCSFTFEKTYDAVCDIVESLEAGT